MGKRHIRSKRMFREPEAASLFPPVPSDLVVAGSPAYELRRLLDTLDLSGVRELYEDHGGYAYDPKRMLGILMLGYLLGVSSSRQLEDRTIYDVRFQFVADGQKPDYRTIARFRRRIAPALEDIFTQVLRRCAEAGLAPLRLGALDGTRLAANASQLRRFIDKDMDQESSDPESRIMRTADGFLRGYNVQALVDADTGVVLGVDVSNQANDSMRMPPTLEAVKRSLGALPDEVVADAGYDSGENLHRAQELGTDAYLAPKDGEALFWTAVSEDEVLCPMGERLEFFDSSTTETRFVDRYAVKTCSSCIFVRQCCGKTGRRHLIVPKGVSPALRVLNAHHCRSPEGKQRMVERKSTVEPLFGHIKFNRRFTRFQLRGLAGALVEARLLTMCINLGKLFRALLAGLTLLWRCPSLTSCRLLQLVMTHRLTPAQP